MTRSRKTDVGCRCTLILSAMQISLMSDWTWGTTWEGSSSSIVYYDRQTSQKMILIWGLLLASWQEYESPKLLSPLVLPSPRLYQARDQSPWRDLSWGFSNVPSTAGINTTRHDPSHNIQWVYFTWLYVYELIIAIQAVRLNYRILLNLQNVQNRQDSSWTLLLKLAIYV